MIGHERGTRIYFRDVPPSRFYDIAKARDFLVVRNGVRPASKIIILVLLLALNTLKFVGMIVQNKMPLGNRTLLNLDLDRDTSLFSFNVCSQQISTALAAD